VHTSLCSSFRHRSCLFGASRTLFHSSEMHASRSSRSTTVRICRAVFTLLGPLAPRRLPPGGNGEAATRGGHARRLKHQAFHQSGHHQRSRRTDRNSDATNQSDFPHDSSASASGSLREPICSTSSASFSSISIHTYFMCNGEACRYTSGYQAGRCTQSGPPGNQEKAYQSKKGSILWIPTKPRTVADFLTADFENEMQKSRPPRIARSSRRSGL
jgi:hypothetical protein